MELERLKTSVRCDIGICKNKAVYTFGGRGILPMRRINMCQECAKELYELLGKEFVPKSPENVIKRYMDIPKRI